jgi:octaprenyl-diphosphate synthase
MNLKEIAKPVADHLEEFNKVYRNSAQSSIGLLNTVIRYILRTKGKQLRPTLVLLSANVCGGVEKDTYLAATLVELLHTATLVHDDVVDDAATRRGLASVNAVWKNKVSILVGDFLLARGLILSIDNNHADFLQVTSTTVRRMSEGELLQIQKTRSLDIDEATYLKIIGDKTASLISTCCELGALSVKADPVLRKRMQMFGENLGIAFQIRDDIFDYISRKDNIGKPVGIDMKEKKFTLPLIHSLKNAPKKVSKEMISQLKSDNLKKTRRVIGDFVHEYGGIEYAMDKAARFSRDAVNVIDSLPDSPSKQSLIMLADYVTQREK